jgi:hypothetical protein
LLANPLGNFASGKGKTEIISTVAANFGTHSGNFCEILFGSGDPAGFNSLHYSPYVKGQL